MSKQDSHFFNVFTMVIGLLVLVTIGIFVLARHLGAVQLEQQASDPLHNSGIAQRIAPPGGVAIAGADNKALAIAPPPGTGTTAALALPADGAATYQQVCSACHGAGIAGAPKAGDHAAWGPRIAQGKETLYKHALEGFTGKSGVMPAKGGRVDLPDELIKQAVDHLTSR